MQEYRRVVSNPPLHRSQWRAEEAGVVASGRKVEFRGAGSAGNKMLSFVLYVWRILDRFPSPGGCQRLLLGDV